VPELNQPPRYVGYPRSNDFGVPGLYGSSKRLAALREAINAGRWHPLLFFYAMLLSKATPKAPLKPFELVAVVFFTVVPSLFFYAWFAKLAEATQFPRVWAIAIALAAFINPFLWLWIPYEVIRLTFGLSVLCAIAMFAEKTVRTETERYGFKFSRKDAALIDCVIDHRRALEAGPTPAPADLLSGECHSAIVRSAD